MAKLRNAFIRIFQCNSNRNSMPKWKNSGIPNSERMKNISKNSENQQNLQILDEKGKKVFENACRQKQRMP